ncbi:hypothetical protein G4D82_03895 [Flavobacterium sp. CYK-4]|uniref:hypothetical protein n=1 Tax=Flavobacterium lotistagni TaxID=2709660 RepID=UPI001407BB0A|nr:hypothetical protein [Flavobacterium lotistagni]NHM06352.1 hypothetical protein [Flavobacterium lotistagni]
MRIFLPLLLITIFIGYLFYLGLVKRNLKSNRFKVVYPGLFFITVWAVIYFVMLQ